MTSGPASPDWQGCLCSTLPGRDRPLLCSQTQRACLKNASINCSRKQPGEPEPSRVSLTLLQEQSRPLCFIVAFIKYLQRLTDHFRQARREPNANQMPRFVGPLEGQAGQQGGEGLGPCHLQSPAACRCAAALQGQRNNEQPPRPGLWEAKSGGVSAHAPTPGQAGRATEHPTCPHPAQPLPPTCDSKCRAAGGWPTDCRCPHVDKGPTLTGAASAVAQRQS